MIIFIEKEQRTVEQTHEGSARELLMTLDIAPDAVLIVADGTLVTPDDDITHAKRIELLSVVSGG